MKQTDIKLEQGFTLVEMAVVLTIVGLLLSGVLMTLSSQRDMKDYVETRNKLALAQEAIYGYAASHIAADGKPYLPCPDIDADGVENRTGSGCSDDVGELPVVDLGLENRDNWNNRFIYHVDVTFADNATGFTLAKTGNISVRESGGGAIVANALPALVLSLGKNGSIAPTAGSDEADNQDDDRNYISREITANFDDLVVWISSPILVNRMVQASRLP